MTNRATLEALLARVQEGTGQDRELDGDLAEALQVGGNPWKHDGDGWISVHGFGCQAAMFTRSIDAALTLVPEGKAWTVGQNVHHWYWSASVNALDEDGAPKSIGWGGPSNSPALALCAAALQARMEALGE
jgi:hypothetical protein